MPCVNSRVNNLHCTSSSERGGLLSAHTGVKCCCLLTLTYSAVGAAHICPCLREELTALLTMDSNLT